MTNLLEKHNQTLKKINSQRKIWAWLSISVIAVIAVFVLDQKHIESTNIIWYFVSFGFIISVLWWYWTMRLIKFIIEYRTEETQILQDIVSDIKYIKKTFCTDLTE